MKKNFKTVLSLVLCLVMIVSHAVILYSCGKNADTDVKYTVVVGEKLTSYTLIRADIIDSVGMDIVQKLHTAIWDSCDVQMPMKSDWVRSEDDIDAEAKEILVGNTNRKETAEVLETLEPNSWAVVNKGNKIVICANNDALLSLAVDWFIENCIDIQGMTVRVQENLVKKDGFGDNLPISIGGASNYRIVYPNGNVMLEYYASLMQKRTTVNGKSIPVVTDDKIATGKEIVIGKTHRGETPSFSGAYEYSITTKDGKIYINASNEKVLYYAVNYYIECGMTITDSVVSAPSDFNVSSSLDNYFSEKWGLNLPYIEEGKISPVYSIGTGLDDDSLNETIIDSYMHLVSNVKETALANYVKKLESFGFNKIYYSKTDENELFGYRLGGAYVYLHFCPKQKALRIVWDKSSNCEISNIDNPVTPNGTTTYYQYSIDYIDARLNYTGKGTNCGMLYFVKLQDNSLIMIDSGSNSQSSEDSLKGLVDFLYDITDTDTGSALKIKMWYFTHSDGDHTALFSRLLDYMANNDYKLPQIDALTFNFPSERANQEVTKDASSYNMIKYINEKYPDIKYFKIHTGMVFNVDEVKVEVLGTIESLLDTTGEIDASYDTNDTCSLIRLWVGDKSIMVSGDIGNNPASVTQYTRLYSDEYLKCDILQISHHGYNLLPSFYNNCAPEHAVVPNAVETLKKQTAKYEFYANLVGNGKLHFAGNYTTALSISGSAITLEKIPRYDNPTGKLN